MQIVINNGNITKGIINEHGGEIRASSEGINKGTTFSLNIPIDQSERMSEYEIEAEHEDRKD